MSTSTATTARSTTARTSRMRRLVAAGGLLAVIAVGTAACSDDSGSPKAAGNQTPLTTLAPKAGTQTGVTTQPAAQPQAQPQGQPTQQPTQPQPQQPTQPQPQQPSSPAPVITSFRTPENIDCHNGNFQNFTAKWVAENAVKTTMSIDGPGIYNTYGTSVEESLPFNCSSSHSFTVTAYGADGRTVSQTITLEPRNVQTSQPDQPHLPYSK
ncbi:MAG: hypothetical protein U0W40_01215 [Acidimicrobiia bacterium]